MIEQSRKKVVIFETVETFEEKLGNFALCPLPEEVTEKHGGKCTKV
jgi:hypothetical protein